MKTTSTFVSLVSAFSLIAGASFAAGGDAPSASDGSQIAASAPGTGAASSVAPSLGSGTPNLAKLTSEGAIPASPAAYPANGMATVANPSWAPESVIGWDSRIRTYTTAYPNRAIVFIEINGAHLCTGFMYARNMVATAGHCVHTGGSSGAWRNRLQMRVYPGRDRTVSPYGFCTVARLHSVVGWTVNNNFRFDYGAMRLNCNVGNTVGWFGLYDGGTLNSAAMISGYPGDKPRDQWASGDKIRTVTAEMIAYRMDTIGGHSGSPVWNDRADGTFGTGTWAVGVHNYGVGAIGTNSNSAARLSAARISNYVAWRDAP
jgi:glutamyl endopeptidase